MIERILLAVDDSPDALAAARLGVPLAAGLGAELRVMHVVVDHEIDALLQTGATELDLAARRKSSANSVLARISDLARAQGVPVTTRLRQGEVAGAVIDEAQGWSADLVIVGRSLRSVSGQPYVGPQTRHILELANVPVLVVPPQHREPMARS